MKTKIKLLRPAAFILLALAAAAASLRAADPDPSGWITLIDGKTLAGWHVSAKSGHSKVSKQTTGGAWKVIDGAITGTQDQPGNGGLVITDRKFGGFEVVLEMRNDFGPDSGFFLRSTGKGKAYQAMIDYHADGNLMGIYGEGLGGKPEDYLGKYVRYRNIRVKPLGPVASAK